MKNNYQNFIMKTFSTYFILFTLLLTISNCKKEEQTKKEFTFPYTFQTYTQTGIFEVYNNEKLLSPNPLQPKHFDEFKNIFESIEKGEIIPKITFKTNSIISVEGYPENNYFFKENVLYVVNLNDTLAFGIGNYSAFKTFGNLTYYSKTDGLGNTSSINSFEFTSKQNSLEQALETSELTALSEIKTFDTLALHSIIINYK
ncbi:MAG: hypothetical protein ACOYMA_04550 [Bacteroidia bacterium]